MIGMTLPVIATIYLDKTNQWADVGFKRRAEALQHIRTGRPERVQMDQAKKHMLTYIDNGAIPTKGLSHVLIISNISLTRLPQ